MSCSVVSCVPAPEPVKDEPPIAFVIDGLEVFAYPAIGYECIKLYKIVNGTFYVSPLSVRDTDFIPFETLWKLKDRVQNS